jgi:hypothetical protein
MAKRRRKRAQAKAKQQGGSAPRKRRRSAGGILELVRGARREAARALERLRAEIAEMRRALETLVAEERSFIAELSGRAVSATRSLLGRRPRRRARPIKRGPTKADRFLGKLPQTFALEDVRRVAGRLAGISLAQWSRAKKIRKTRAGYAKAS